MSFVTIASECIYPCKATSLKSCGMIHPTGKRGLPSPRLNILTTGTPILLFYGVKPVFIILEDIENYTISARIYF